MSDSIWSKTMRATGEPRQAGSVVVQGSHAPLLLSTGNAGLSARAPSSAGDIGQLRLKSLKKPLGAMEPRLDDKSPAIRKLRLKPQTQGHHLAGMQDTLNTPLLRMESPLGNAGNRLDTLETKLEEAKTNMHLAKDQVLSVTCGQRQAQQTPLYTEEDAQEAPEPKATKQQRKQMRINWMIENFKQFATFHFDEE